MKDLLDSLYQQILPEAKEVEEVTNVEYRNMQDRTNDLIRDKQQKYYEAHTNASTVNLG